MQFYDSLLFTWKNVCVTVLLHVVGLESDKRSIRFGNILAQFAPLLGQSVLVVQVLFHVRKDDMAGCNVHVHIAQWLLAPLI